MFPCSRKNFKNGSINTTGVSITNEKQEELVPQSYFIFALFVLGTRMRSQLQWGRWEIPHISAIIIVECHLIGYLQHGESINISNLRHPSYSICKCLQNKLLQQFYFT
jgi:hypothetical protein